MINAISLATSYLQTFVIHMDGTHELRSHATGFFIRLEDEILLLTNWHVLSGLDPANPKQQTSALPSPHYLKATVLSKDNKTITELSIPLYDPEMRPLWDEHPNGSAVDIGIIHLPTIAEEHFKFVDIHSVQDETTINEAVGREVFIVGYPYSKLEMKEVFGEDAVYYIPTWKRGSIATEPSLRLGERVILIDSLSRPGMSGAPIFIAHESRELMSSSATTTSVMKRIGAGDHSAILDLDMSDTKSILRKRFRFLGIYSGTIGSTKLAEVALGKCWHADVIREAVSSPKEGVMEYHSPVENEHYLNFLNKMSGIILKYGMDGKETGRVPL